MGAILRVLMDAGFHIFHALNKVGAPPLRFFLAQGWEATPLTRRGKASQPHRRCLPKITLCERTIKTCSGAKPCDLDGGLCLLNRKSKYPPPTHTFDLTENFADNFIYYPVSGLAGNSFSKIKYMQKCGTGFRQNANKRKNTNAPRNHKARSRDASAVELCSKSILESYLCRRHCSSITALRSQSG
jgi:hypothetical protein